MKPISWRLTPKAAETMADIGAWTGGQFGERQAETYLEVLIAQCSKIAGGLAHVQSCRDVFAPDLREDLRISRAGQHLSGLRLC